MPTALLNRVIDSDNFTHDEVTAFVMHPDSPLKCRWAGFAKALAFVFCSVFASQTSFAVDCGSCTELDLKIKLHYDLRTRVAQMLKVNETYRATLAPNDTSKQIKVTSNIIIAQAKLETIQNNLEALSRAKASKGCATCPATSP